MSNEKNNPTPDKGGWGVGVATSIEPLLDPCLRRNCKSPPQFPLQYAPSQRYMLFVCKSACGDDWIGVW